MSEHSHSDTSRLVADLKVQEFVALRQEIIKRIELSYQFINLTIIAAGAIFTVGLQGDAPASILLMYPIVSTFLVSGIANHSDAVGKIAYYIRTRHEAVAGGMWEQYLADRYPRGPLFGPFDLVAFIGVPLSTQGIAILLAALKGPWSKGPWAKIDIVLAVLSLLATVFSIYLAKRMHRQTRTTHDEPNAAGATNERL
jgi:hypothetical protein